MNTKLSGAMGEAYTAEWLRKRRWKVLAMNYRCKFGELDLVAAKRKELLFVEVKLRKAGGLTRPADAVSRSKQEKLRAAADLWLAQNPAHAALRQSFAVAELTVDERGEVQSFSLMENAF